MNILEWGETHPTFYLSKEEGICSVAASGGHLSMIKWINERHFDHKDIFREAAANGHRHILEYMLNEGTDAFIKKENGEIEQWGIQDKGYHYYLQDEGKDDIPSVIIKKDRFDILKWMEEIDILAFWGEIGGFSELYDAAISTANLPILKWLTENGFDFETYRINLKGLDEQKVLLMIKWLYSTGRRIPDLHLKVVEAGFLSIIEYMVSKLGLYHIITREFYKAAILSSESIKMLEWMLREIDTPGLFIDERYLGDDFPFDWQHITCIALNNTNIEVIEWILENSDESLITYEGYFLHNAQTIEKLIKRGSIDLMVTFMRLSGLQFKSNIRLVGLALDYGHLRIAKWLEEQGGGGAIDENIIHFYYDSILKGKEDIESLKWVKSLSSFPLPSTVIRTAAIRGLLPIFIWAVVKEGEKIGIDIFTRILNGDSLNILIWIEGAYPEIANKYRDTLKNMHEKDDKIGKYLKRK